MGRMMLLLLVVAPMILISQASTFQKSYTIKLSKNGKDYFERIKIDAKKKTETSQVREAVSGKDAGETIYDFKRNLTMTRIPEAKSCFLSESVENVPRPADLLQLLRTVSRYAAVKMTPETEVTFKVVGKLRDRSGLSKEMADLCANLPIYRVAEGGVDQDDTADQMSDEEDAGLAEKTGAGPIKRRGLCRHICRVFCWYKCGWGGCSRVCKRICSWIC